VSQHHHDENHDAAQNKAIVVGFDLDGVRFAGMSSEMYPCLDELIVIAVAESSVERAVRRIPKKYCKSL